MASLKPVTAPSHGKSGNVKAPGTDLSLVKTPEPTAEGSSPTAAATIRRMGDRPHMGSSELETLDRITHAMMGRAFSGLSPVELMLDYQSWITNLSASPGRQLRLVEKAWRKVARFQRYTNQTLFDPNTPLCIEPLPQDRRFSHPEWRRWPYSWIHQAYLLNQQWWHNATTNIPGMSKHSELAAEFTARQILDTMSPSNAPWLNPEILEATAKESGANLERGASHYLDDLRRQLLHEKPAGTEDFKVGEAVAVTPGKVIFRNALIELIQYSPATDTVQAEPLLMLSAWMMKYYIMDLSPHNSMVKYLVDHGHTVFMISWRNPGPKDRSLGLEDYRKLGIMAALEVVSEVIPDRKIHAVGYCLGGILLTIAAAAMARDGDDRLASVTLFTTMTDFTEVGELSVFMGPSQVTFLEDMMWQQGYMEDKQVAGSFLMLRSKDLIWSRMMREYFLGRREPMIDLMAWNADGTRMPYRMHSELLRKLYIGNELAQGHYLVEGRPIALADIHVPVFAVSAVRDHVAPWKSVFKLHLQSDANELTFVLTSGGHNVGIVNEPGHPRRSYQIATAWPGDKYVDPDTWQSTVPMREGSWWPAWQDWLTQHSSAGNAEPRIPGATSRKCTPLCDAPGTYVLQ
jgi:polyhydroxyalkanoate synthase